MFVCQRANVNKLLTFRLTQTLFVVVIVFISSFFLLFCQLFAVFETFLYFHFILVAHDLHHNITNYTFAHTHTHTSNRHSFKELNEFPFLFVTVVDVVFVIAILRMFAYSTGALLNSAFWVGCWVLCDSCWFFFCVLSIDRYYLGHNDVSSSVRSETQIECKKLWHYSRFWDDQNEIVQCQKRLFTSLCFPSICPP